MKYENTFYRVKVLKKKTKNELHRDIANNKIGVPICLIEGKEAYFCIYIPDDPLVPWHRMKTTAVEKIEYDGSDIILETSNTIYKFVKEEYSSPEGQND